MIRVQNLCAGYGGVMVLKGMTFSLPKGGFTGILGPNACGKSTLIKVLSGALGPADGAVSVGGVNPAFAPPMDLAKIAATIPQFTEIPFPFTGFEIVMMGRFPHLGRFSRAGEVDVRAVQIAMEETDTQRLAQRHVTQVSGGERQRLILARALAQTVGLLLLDEATASMDVHRKIQAFDLLEKLNRQGVAVLAAMHDLNLASLYCREMIFMKDGRILASGPTEEVFTQETIEEVYETPVRIVPHPTEEKPQAVFVPGCGRFRMGVKP